MAIFPGLHPAWRKHADETREQQLRADELARIAKVRAASSARIVAESADARARVRDAADIFGSAIQSAMESRSD